MVGVHNDHTRDDVLYVCGDGFAERMVAHTGPLGFMTATTVVAPNAGNACKAAVESVIRPRLRARRGLSHVRVEDVVEVVEPRKPPPYQLAIICFFEHDSEAICEARALIEELEAEHEH